MALHRCRAQRVPHYFKMPIQQRYNSVWRCNSAREFWNSVSTKSPNYHVLVSSPTIAKTLTISIPPADGTTVVDPSSGKTIGIININWFDPQLQTLLTSLGFTPNMLPIFLSHNVYLSQGAANLNNCCIGGYHNAIRDTAGLQTYIWSTDLIRLFREALVRM